MDTHKKNGVPSGSRARAAEEEISKKEAKRRRTLFQPRKVIGPRDIFVDRSTGKIKIDEVVDVKPVLTEALQKSVVEGESVQAESSIVRSSNKPREFRVHPTTDIVEENGLAHFSADDNNPDIRVVEVDEEVDLLMELDFDDSRVSEDEVGIGTCSSSELSLLRLRCKEKDLKIKQLMEQNKELENLLISQRASAADEHVQTEEERISHCSNTVNLEEEINNVTGHGCVVEEEPTSTQLSTDNDDLRAQVHELREQMKTVLDQLPKKRGHLQETAVQTVQLNLDTCGEEGSDSAVSSSSSSSSGPNSRITQAVDSAISHLNENESANLDKQVLLFPTVLPLLSEDLEKKDMLNCRGVCSKWKVSVDQFLEHHVSQGPEDAAISLKRIKTTRYWPLSKKNMKYMVVVEAPMDSRWKYMLAQEIKERGVMTHVGRSVEFNHAEDDDDAMSIEDYYMSIEEFLAVFGDGIWYVSFILWDDESEDWLLKHRSGLQGILKKLPNLRSLELNAFPCPTRRSKGGNRLGELPSLDSLPHLPYLETLILYQWGTDRQDVFNIEVLYNGYLHTYLQQTKSICLNWVLGDEICGNEFKNMIELNVYCRRVRNVSRMLTQLGNVTFPNLETLSICHYDTPLTELFNLAKKHSVKFFQIDPYASPRLKNLNQYWKLYSSKADTLPTLPSVTSLNLLVPFDSHQKSLIPANFLKSLPMLEYLFIGQMFKGSRIREMFEIAGKNVSIWKLLPKLKMCAFRNYLVEIIES